ncbi:MAG: immunoglobulin domain-containing protein, partial [Verrucomicrobiota bacterium]
MNKTLSPIAFGALLSFLCVSQVWSETIPGIFSTGVDNAGELLGSGEPELHYQLIESPDAGYPGPEVVTLNPGFPVGPWLEEGPDSRWIAPRAEQGIGNEPGVYVYRLTFGLAGFDPDTVVIRGRWSMDDGGPDIRLNEESLFFSGSGFQNWADFEISEGFQAGENTLDFEVSNGGDSRNPTGLRVHIESATGDLLDGAAPSLVIQPEGGRVIEGDSFTMAVTAAGTPPLAYAWEKDGGAVDGVDQSQWTLDDLTEEESGTYRVTVSNGFGSIVSDPVDLTVLRSISGLFGTGLDEQGSPLADLAVDPHFRIVENPDGASMDAIVHDTSIWPLVEGPWLGLTEGSRWIGPRGDTGAAAGGTYVYRTEVDLTGLEPSTAKLLGSWASDNATVDVRLNGASLGLKNEAGFGAFNTFVIEDVPFITGVNTLDFVVNNAGAGPTALRIENLKGGAEPATGGGKAPEILVQPEDTEALVGESVRLVVLADGTPPLSYEWRRGDEVVGQEPELLLPEVLPGLEGEYVATVTNGEGTVTSDSATLSILEPIPGLFNTGVDETGAPLEDFEPDPHFKLISDPNEEGLEAIVLSSTAFPIVEGPWVPNNERSKWIGVREDNNGPVGDYVYRISFDLAAFDPEKVFVEGEWGS